MDKVIAQALNRVAWRMGDMPVIYRLRGLRHWMFRTADRLTVAQRVSNYIDLAVSDYQRGLMSAERAMSDIAAIIADRESGVDL